MKFAKIVFWTAGAWGLMVLTPMYFLFDFVGRQDPPAVTHPQFYYGFVGVGLAWQVAFCVIGSDPQRLRLMMVPAVIEKFSFAITVSVLAFQGRMPVQQSAIAVPDALLGILFMAAFLKTDEKNLA